MLFQAYWTTAERPSWPIGGRERGDGSVLRKVVCKAEPSLCRGPDAGDGVSGAQEHVDEGRDVGNGDFAVLIHIGTNRADVEVAVAQQPVDEVGHVADVD